MSLIWIRHGEKKFRNGKGIPGYYKHDPPLKEDCDSKINIVGYSIYLNSGVPDKIICSPFLRTREIAKKLQEFFFMTYNKFVDISIDNNIREFLGWVKPPGIKAEVSEETQQYVNPILGIEKIKDVEERSKIHVNSINKHQKLLIITHGIVIEFIYKYLTGSKLNRVKELSGISLSRGNIEEFNIMSKIL